VIGFAHVRGDDRSLAFRARAQPCPVLGSAQRL
jgi:hypothetical protein